MENSVSVCCRCAAPYPNTNCRACKDSPNTSLHCWDCPLAKLPTQDQIRFTLFTAIPSSALQRSNVLASALLMIFLAAGFQNLSCQPKPLPIHCSTMTVRCPPDGVRNSVPPPPVLYCMASRHFPSKMPTTLRSTCCSGVRCASNVCEPTLAVGNSALKTRNN